MNLEKFILKQGKYAMEDIIKNKVELLFDLTDSISGVTEAQIKSKKRNEDIAVSRNIVGYMLHNELGITVMRSGSIINRDHSTITHYTKTFEANYNHYSKYRELYSAINEAFWSHFIEAESGDIDLEVKKLQSLIDKLENKKMNLLTKNN